MVLKPLEFADCITDSPWFRSDLTQHEASLRRASDAIKNIESECSELVKAARKLSRAQRNFSQALRDFKFDSIGDTQTDEERVIADSLSEFSSLLDLVEEQRDRILDEAEQNYISPLRKFREERIQSALSDERKKFEKASTKYYQSVEKHLQASTTKKNDMKEHDASLQLQQRSFNKASLEYVYTVQTAHERLKFEFVEILCSFIYSWMSFYHYGQVAHEDFKPFLDSLQTNMQKARENFSATDQEARELKQRTLNVRNSVAQSSASPAEIAPGPGGKFVKQGYLYLLERKNLISTWTKCYCLFQKENCLFTFIPFPHAANKQDIKQTIEHSSTHRLKQCTRRATDSIDRRFCFDVQFDNAELLTFQALSEDDRREWLDITGGKEPIYNPNKQDRPFEAVLDEVGFKFIRSCLTAIEHNGLDEQGLYRHSGVQSKVVRLLTHGLDKSKVDKLNLSSSGEFEVRTITSAVKQFLRSLKDPLMTFELHEDLMNAAKVPRAADRIHAIHILVHKLPSRHFEMLQLLICHLKKVSEHSDKNLMSIGNLGVCFGPTLLRTQEESLAAIMDIKFCNVMVEALITNYDMIFRTKPGAPPSRPEKPAHGGIRQPLKQNTNLVNGQHAMSSSMHETRSHTPLAITNPLYATSRAVRPSAIYQSDMSNDGSSPDVSFAGNVASGALGASAASASCSSSPAHRTLTVSTASPRQQGTGAATDPESLSQTPSPSVHLATTSFPLHHTGSQSSLGRTVSYAPPYRGALAQAQNRRSIDLALGERTSGRRVRALYACEAGHESEVSFQPGQIITNVVDSKEPGWLVGTINGKTGMVPENYVEPLL